MSLNEWIPRTYVQLRGNYAFVEEVLDIAHDRINAVLEIGYFPTPEWNVRVMVSQQWTNGGINVPVPLDDPRFPYHDQLAAEEFVARILVGRLEVQRCSVGQPHAQPA